MRCSRLHYVAHRLTLGTAGLRELMCVEQKLLGHSELASVSQSAVFAVPQMDFESELHGRSASFALRADKLVQQHLEVRLQLSDRRFKMHTRRPHTSIEQLITDVATCTGIDS